MVELVILLFVVLAVACFGLLLPFLRLAVGIVLLVVRLMLEARWREERAGSVSEESHESA